jgi:hypothetical protein
MYSCYGDVSKLAVVMHDCVRIYMSILSEHDCSDGMVVAAHKLLARAHDGDVDLAIFSVELDRVVQRLFGGSRAHAEAEAAALMLGR